MNQKASAATEASDRQNQPPYPNLSPSRHRIRGGGEHGERTAFERKGGGKGLEGRLPNASCGTEVVVHLDLRTCGIMESGPHPTSPMSP